MAIPLLDFPNCSSALKNFCSSAAANQEIIAPTQFPIPSQDIIETAVASDLIACYSELLFQFWWR